MTKTFTIKRSGKADAFPPLPFYPRSAGVNFFRRGEREDVFPEQFVEICWVCKGTCEIESFGHTRMVSAGECVFRRPGEFRRKHALTESAVVRWAAFDGPGAFPFLKSFQYPEDVLHGGPCPEDLFERIERGLASMETDALRKVFPLFTELIVRAGGYAAETSAGKLADECLYRMKSSYGNPDFNVNTLADTLGVHRTTVDRLIRKAVGMPPLEYLTALRMDRALELLRNSLLSVSEIAARTGFCQSGYFCRLVRRKTGMSPLEYRAHGNTMRE